jgi:hypothetical protein
MSSTHRTLDGAWEACADKGVCDLPLHVELPLVEAQHLPDDFIEQLAEAFDPPTSLLGDTKMWLNERSSTHRDYGLPAVIQTDGRAWFVEGRPHRKYGPAYVLTDGTQAWIQHGLLHRDGGLPAVTMADGHAEWWEQGFLIRATGPERILNVYGLSVTQREYRKRVPVLGWRD